MRQLYDFCKIPENYLNDKIKFFKIKYREKKN